jgi:photosystem II stability/assembly factor-like uncharacterized protein
MKKLVLFFLLTSFLAKTQEWKSLYGPANNTPYGILEYNGSLFLAADWGNYKSTDGGNNWNEINLPCPEYGGTATPFWKAGGKIFFRNYFSSDGGDTWSIMNNLDEMAIKYVENGQDIFALNYVFGPFYSHDGGQTWKNIKLNLPNGGRNGMVIVNNRVYVSIDDKGVYYSDLSDSTWHDISSGLPSLWTWRLETDGAYLYTGTSSNGIYRYSILNSSWESINDSNTATANVSAIYLDNKNIYIGSYQGTYKSALNNFSWQLINDSSISEFIYHPAASMFFTKDSALFAGFNYKALYKTSDNGKNWTLLNKGMYAGSRIDFLYSTNGSLWAAYPWYHQISKSTDEGENWSPVKFNYEIWYPNGHLSALFADGNDIFYGEQNGGIYYSNDGGTTFALSDSSMLNNYYKYANEFTSLNGVAYVLYNDKLYKSSDKGKSWHPVNAINGIWTITSFNNAIYAGAMVSGKGTIYKSTDGINWNICSTFPQSNGIVKFTSSGNSLYVYTYNQNAVYISNDNGMTWNELNYSGLPSVNLRQLQAAGNNLYAVPITYDSHGGEIYYGVFKYEGGSWQPFGAGLKQLGVNCLATDGKYLYAGIAYDGVYKILLDGATGTEESFSAFSTNIFPNPSFGKFTIHSSEKFSSVLITNCLGKKVYQQDISDRRSAYSIAVDLSSQAKGIYLVEILFGSETRVEKIILE